MKRINNSRKIASEKGQTLVLLLMYVVIAMIVVTAAVAISIVNSQATASVHGGATAIGIAESGIETAIIKLLRDPEYGGEDLTIETGNATITVTGSTIKTITSVGTIGKFTRTIQATVDTSGNIINVTEWEEI